MKPPVLEQFQSHSPRQGNPHPQEVAGDSQAVLSVSQVKDEALDCGCWWDRHRGQAQPDLLPCAVTLLPGWGAQGWGSSAGSFSCLSGLKVTTWCWIASIPTAGVCQETCCIHWAFISRGRIMQVWRTKTLPSNNSASLQQRSGTTGCTKKNNVLLIAFFHSYEFKIRRAYFTVSTVNVLFKY